MCLPLYETLWILTWLQDSSSLIGSGIKPSLQSQASEMQSLSKAEKQLIQKPFKHQNVKLFNNMMAIPAFVNSFNFLNYYAFSAFFFLQCRLSHLYFTFFETSTTSDIITWSIFNVNLKQFLVWRLKSSYCIHLQAKHPPLHDPALKVITDLLCSWISLPARSLNRPNSEPVQQPHNICCNGHVHVQEEEPNCVLLPEDVICYSQSSLSHRWWGRGNGTVSQM